MIKVLLVIDDYNELMYLQTTLKKLGFDVEGISKTSTVPSQILIFRPNIIVITAQSKKINGYQVSLDIKSKNPYVNFVLIKHGKQDFIDRLVKDGEVDACVDSPVNITKLIQTMHQICHFNIDIVIEKLNKLSKRKEADVDVKKIKSVDDLEKPGLPLVDLKEKRNQPPVEEERRGTKQKTGDDSEGVLFDKLQYEKFNSSPISPEQRSINFTDFLKKEKLEGRELEKTFYSRNTIRDFSKSIRKENSKEDDSEIKEQKKDFVKALFKKIK